MKRTANSMKIGNVELKSNLLLAPLAGFTDAGFRAICVHYGAGLTYTEMVSVKGLCYGNKGTEKLLYTTESENPVAVQIFGHEPESVYKAVSLDSMQKFDIIDINMGCPVRKIVSNGDGSALMKNPSLITELVQAAVEGSKKPVTVKLRTGIKFGEPLATECALAAERGGAAAVTIHPRFAEQFYSGAADHNITREVKNAIHIPVVANGDITDSDSLNFVKELSGADAFMIGRGALGKPCIFAKLRDEPYEFCVRNTVLEHISVLLQVLPPRTVTNVMKLHLCHYAKNTDCAKAIRGAISTIKTMNDIYNIIDNYLS